MSPSLTENHVMCYDTWAVKRWSSEEKRWGLTLQSRLITLISREPARKRVL